MTLTIRLPRKLRDLAQEAAARDELTESEWWRRAAVEAIRATARATSSR